ncbi:hypothetical protein ACHAWF_009351 [Thalassiosira exigua]
MLLASSVIAGCVVHAVAAEAGAANAAAGSALAAPTTDKGRPKKHRLLQKFKNRRRRLHDAQPQSGSEADLGVLSSNAPRFLQDEDDYDYYCPRETCPSALCDCAEQGGSLEDCTPQLQDVCRAGKLGDCVFRDYVQVYEEVYCPFVSCTTDGFREQQCDCAFYDLYCDRLEGQECKEVLGLTSDEADKKPFFGCDETELRSVCDEAHACKGRGELQGLPIGTWKGSVTTGIRNSGERMMGGSVVAGVAVMSALWLMVNV